MIRGVHHVALSTPDLDRLASFYCDNFGFEVIRQNEWADNSLIDQLVGLDGSVARSVMLSAGNSHIELFEYSNPVPVAAEANRPVCDHGYTHFCLEVEDVNAEYERLGEVGMTFHCPPLMPSSSGALMATYGRDPDGNVIELLEIRDPDDPMRLDAVG